LPTSQWIELSARESVMVIASFLAWGARKRNEGRRSSFKKQPINFFR
jgi:hypothetical protein